MSASLMVQTAVIAHYCIATAPQSDLIFHATTCSTTVCATGRAIVPSACSMDGTA